MNNFFLDTLRHLRSYEEIVLYNDLLLLPEWQQQETLAYLKEEYQNESVAYPSEAPVFDGEAALWAARTVYTASQLVLYRKHNVADIPALLPAGVLTRTPAAILSADLLLRFLPSVILQLKALDPEDPLILLLEAHLVEWHYSGIPHPLPTGQLRFEDVLHDKCLCRLYIDRIIACKRLPLALHPLLVQYVNASLGMFAAVYWKDFAQQAPGQT